MSAVMARRAWVEQIMGFPVSVHVRGDDPDSAERAVATVFAELRAADAAFSTYLDDSDLSRWERGELPLTTELAAVVALCEVARERTDGWFDPRSGPRYDPSGLVKGWAVQRAARHLTRLGEYGWCLNAGGDVLVHAPEGQPEWRIGVEDPYDPGRLIHVVSLRDGAVATSGTAHRGEHIIDPRTRRPATRVRAVTVVGPDLLWSDVYATAAAARGPSAIEWLDGVDGYEALLVTALGAVRVTSKWKQEAM
ncbi:FAD:protein FMN transferase [Streptosporangiaceae bacterium NEAU-GS5]|nr:FAD:protein FMN transferase [Streptosporangiaceae bacterium NEAU-GS5]